MRARRRSGHVVAEMLVAAAGLVTLAVRQSIAQPDFQHTSDTAAGHRFTIKLEWDQTRRSSRLVTAICASRVRDHTNRFAAAKSSQSACLAPIHNTFTTHDTIQTKFNLSWTLSVQRLYVKLCSKRLSFVRNQMLTLTKEKCFGRPGPGRTDFNSRLP